MTTDPSQDTPPVAGASSPGRPGEPREREPRGSQRSDRPAGSNHPDAGTRPDPAPAGIPRWVKVFGLVGLVLVVLLIVLLATGHGPGRHSGGAAPPSSVSQSAGARLWP
jgi:hypothetical protein